MPCSRPPTGRRTRTGSPSASRPAGPSRPSPALSACRGRASGPPRAIRSGSPTARREHCRARSRRRVAGPHRAGSAAHRRGPRAPPAAIPRHRQGRRRRPDPRWRTVWPGGRPARPFRARARARPPTYAGDELMTFVDDGQVVVGQERNPFQRVDREQCVVRHDHVGLRRDRPGALGETLDPEGAVRRAGTLAGLDRDLGPGAVTVGRCTARSPSPPALASSSPTRATRSPRGPADRTGRPRRGRPDRRAPRPGLGRGTRSCFAP